MTTAGERSPLEADARTILARAHLVRGDVIPAGLVDSVIERSWKRSVSFGLDVAAPPNLEPVSAHELRALRERNRLLVEVAQPELENLFQQIANTRSIVMLTDAEATILASMSVDASLKRWAGLPGMCWSEQRTGTNAMGTSIAERRTVSVFGHEHYLERIQPFSCLAVPLLDPFGNLLGVLDISGGDSVRQNHIRSLAAMSGQMIENRLISTQLEARAFVKFHSRPEFLGTLWEAIAAFDDSGTLIAANRAALSLLEIDRQQFGVRLFPALFDCPYDRLLDHFSVSGRSPLLLHLHCGVRVYVSAGAAADRRCAANGVAVTRAAIRTGLAPPHKPDRCLADVTFGDGALHNLLHRAKLAFAAGLAIVLEGETGSGKEVLAKALHRESPRKDGPFVAINCASIPENLIESELFGYGDGAFTGARRGGACGRVQLAHSGTLFLDEIGDMPLSQQARLLRVLQEREVTPLGGGKPVRVDIAVICATHTNLKEQVEQGRFRSDLYYRLNGLRVELPPLRRRDNLREIVLRVLADKSGSRAPVTVSDEVMDVFLDHPWPGNMRQLCNVISTALALLGADGEIELRHLADDFLSEMLERPAGEGNGAAALPIGTLMSMEVRAVQSALERHRGNISAAASALGISRATLYRKIKQYLPHLQHG
ncbi:MAG: sigma-54-dependent Fis family transcriptional regulator [Proteobacteria bacterium]|jgi:transcriptional regulator of acetoin/glycerol metabolism|nr:sigma-54-dependent Fis family transcriptional regulator [Pseudomonadota bacterium]